MKYKIYLLLILTFCHTLIKGQGSLTCSDKIKKYDFGYLNYNQLPLGTIVRASYSNFLLWHSLKGIKPVGNITILASNNITSNPSDDTLSLNEELSLDLAGNMNSGIKASVAASANSSLRIIYKNGKKLLIKNVSLCQNDIESLHLPKLNGRDFYAIVNQTTIADTIKVGFLSNNQLSASINVPTTGNATVKVSLGCGKLVNFNGISRNVFYDIMPINENGTVSNISVKDFIILKEQTDLKLEMEEKVKILEDIK